MNTAAPANVVRKIWSTPGGVHPPENKSQSLELPLESLAQPPEVILPLSQHIGAQAEATVQVGDTVKRGQVVGAAKGMVSANVHASISGTVTAIEPRPIAHPSGMSDTCIVITNDYQNSNVEFIPCVQYRQLHIAEIMQRIEAAGIVGMGGAGFPTAVKLQPKENITTLIVNGTECEPYITADDSLMQNFAEELVSAIEMLDYVLSEPAEVLIAIEDNKAAAIDCVQQALDKIGNSRIEVCVLPTKYPSGGEKQLIQMLTGKEVGSGQIPASLGIVCQNVGTVLAAYNAVVKGEPLTNRITTFAGNAIRRQQSLIVPIGTPIEFVLMQQGLQDQQLARLVMGGPMMGFTLQDSSVPVVKTTNCVLALDHQESPAPQPAMACIRCGMCAEACPASLLPQQLYWYARAEDHEKLNAHNLFDCIECGACSYACPSHIPLVQYYRSAKAEIRQAELEKIHSDKARERFEFHKQRIEEEKQARAEAKRIAAEKAAEKAKLREAKKAEEEKKALEANEATTTTEDVDVDVDVDIKKLQRSLASSEDRLEKLQQKLQSDDLSEDQKQSTQARIKETELKCEQLRHRIASAESNEAQPAKLTEVEPAPTSSLVEEKTENSQEIDNNTQLPQANTSANQAQLDVWQAELEQTREKIAQTSADNAEKLSALKLAEQVLSNKIASATIVEDNTAPTTNPKLDGDDRLQRVMEMAISKNSSEKDSE